MKTQVVSAEGEVFNFTVAGCEDMTEDQFKTALSRYTDEYREELSAVFSKYQNKENWKFGFMATITDVKEAYLLIDAIGFFLGDKPKTEITRNGITIRTRGYQAW